MTPVKRRLLYIFRDTLLRLRISWPKGNTLTLSVGYHIDRRRWDGSRCTRNSSHGPQQIPAATINRTLQSLEDTITAAFYSFEAKDITPTPAQLKETISPSDSDRTTPSLLAPLAENYIARVSVLSPMVGAHPPTDTSGPQHPHRNLRPRRPHRQDDRRPHRAPPRLYDITPSLPHETPR